MKNFYLLFLLLIINISAQNDTEYFKFLAPDFIPYSSETEVASICRFEDGNYDEIEILINTDLNVILTGIKLNSLNHSHKLQFQLLEDHMFDGNLYSIIIPRKNYKLINNTIEIIYKLDLNNINETSINYIVYYLDKGEIVNEFSSFDEFRYKPLNLATYTPQELASGKALTLHNDDKFSLNVSGEDYENFVVEFWGKFNDVDDFLEFNFENTESFSLKKNQFGILETNEIDNLEITKTSFLAKNSWNHICLFYDNDSEILQVFVNEELNFKIYNKFEGSFNFKLFNKKSEFDIDLLKVWNLQDDISQIFENKRFNSNYIGNSILLYKNSFDDFTKVNSNLSLSISEAPISSRAPELNIKSYSNFYILDWQSVDNKNVKEYILEKSIDGRSFSEIYRIEKFTSKVEQYTFTDIKNTTDKLVFYRIQQINNDGSTVYSTQLKIGQKKRKNFILKPNFPNPFNPKTKITVDLLEDTDIIVTVYNIVGIKVAKIFTGSLIKGEHNFDFDGSELTSGIYLLEIKTPVSTEVMKMILAK